MINIDKNTTRKKYAFVCGLHKSGTSILFNFLRDHPEISGFQGTGVPEDEGQHLQSVFPPAKAFGGAGRFGFNPASHLDESSPLASPANAKKIHAEWGRYWDLELPVLLEKSPPNLIRMRFLQSLFPNSYFIVILRHPIAVSLATQKWSKTSFHSLMEHWLICHELFLYDKDSTRNVTIVKYEELIENPQPVIAEIIEYFGLRQHAIALDIRSDINKKYFRKWSSYRNNPILSLLTRLLIRKFEKRVNRFGYSLCEIERCLPVRQEHSFEA